MLSASLSAVAPSRAPSARGGAAGANVLSAVAPSRAPSARGGAAGASVLSAVVSCARAERRGDGRTYGVAPSPLPKSEGNGHQLQSVAIGGHQRSSVAITPGLKLKQRLIRGKKVKHCRRRQTELRRELRGEIARDR